MPQTMLDGMLQIVIGTHYPLAKKRRIPLARFAGEPFLIREPALAHATQYNVYLMSTV